MVKNKQNSDYFKFFLFNTEQMPNQQKLINNTNSVDSTFLSHNLDLMIEFSGDCNSHRGRVQKPYWCSVRSESVVRNGNNRYLFGEIYQNSPRLCQVVSTFIRVAFLLPQKASSSHSSKMNLLIIKQQTYSHPILPIFVVSFFFTERIYFFCLLPLLDMLDLFPSPPRTAHSPVFLWWIWLVPFYLPFWYNLPFLAIKYWSFSNLNAISQISGSSHCTPENGITSVQDSQKSGLILFFDVENFKIF